MYGVPKGVHYCNNYRVDELNDRIYDRNLPSTSLQMNFDPRAVKTRQVLFPVLDCQHTSDKTPIIRRPAFNTMTEFNPGTSAPYSGYATHIDQDSRVKDMFMPAQKWATQTEFIPSSNSDMYHVNVPSGKPVAQPYPLLFKKETFNYFNPNPCNLGGNLLYNHTRQQVKGGALPSKP
jgi:hypothetical protein